MYYYIFEPPQGAKEHERNAQIKELISSLGIAGEMATPSPGKSVEDLVGQAIAKRYSTIVAVGTVPLINQCARALEPYDAVFGIIPTVEHPDIANLIGVSDWKNAAEQLKRRRFHSFRQGVVNEQFFFLTPATLSLPEKTEYQVISGQYSFIGQGGEIRITPYFLENDSEPENDQNGLIIEILTGSQTQKGGFLKSLFGKNSKIVSDSRFHLPSFQLLTDSGIPVSVAGSVLTSTPLICTTREKNLKLIVGKAAK